MRLSSIVTAPKEVKIYSYTGENYLVEQDYKLTGASQMCRLGSKFRVVIHSQGKALDENAILFGRGRQDEPVGYHRVNHMAIDPLSIPLHI